MTRAEIWLLDNMPRTGCALYAFKHAKDKDYMGKAVQTDSLVLKCHELGNENPDKNIYLIEPAVRNNGFFAVYHKVLKYLYYADRFHMTPVVSYSGDYLYAEDHTVHGHENPFEYYYEQPGGVSLESAMGSRNVFKSENIHTCIGDLVALKAGDYEVTEEYIRLLGSISAKYIHLNKETGEKLKKDMSGAKTDDETIGVHYRGTDFKRGFTGHPVHTGIGEYIEKVGKLLKNGPYEKIFLASDDTEALRQFDKEFPGKVFYYDDVYRADGDVSVAFSADKRKDHHYLLGMEVLRDMYSLAGCGALVSGVSQVSVAARITKASKGNAYRDTEIIFHGVSLKGANDREYYRTYGVRR